MIININYSFKILNFVMFYYLNLLLLIEVNSVIDHL